MDACDMETVRESSDVRPNARGVRAMPVPLTGDGRRPGFYAPDVGYMKCEMLCMGEQ